MSNGLDTRPGFDCTSVAMLSRIHLLFVLSLSIVGCGGSPTSFKDAEALEVQGKCEEAAGKFELVCAEAPGGPECREASTRAVKSLITAAEKALMAKEFGKSERLLVRALASADDATTQDITSRLGRQDLLEGIRYELAAADPDKLRASKTMEAIATGNNMGATLAKEWLDKERPALIVAQVKAACGPQRDGSCTETYAKLEALTAKPAGADEAKAAYDAEQKRTEKFRAEAERFLPVFAQRGKKEQALAQCLVAKEAEFASEKYRTAVCREEVYADGKSTYERFDAQQTEENLFRRRLTAIGDPALITSFEVRRAEVLRTGEYQKPEAKKAAGGGK